MWVLIRDWGSEQSVDYFRTNKEAETAYKDWIKITKSVMFVAEVDEELNTFQYDHNEEE